MSTYKNDGHTLKRVGECEYVSSVMTITPVLNTIRYKMGNMDILLIIDNGVYVCICTFYYFVFKEVTHHAFVYDSN